MVDGCVDNYIMGVWMIGTRYVGDGCVDDGCDDDLKMMDDRRVRVWMILIR